RATAGPARCEPGRKPRKNPARRTLRVDIDDAEVLGVDGAVQPVDETLRYRSIDREHRERRAGLLVARDLQARDVHAGLAEQPAVGRDNARAIAVAEHQQVRRHGQLDFEAVDLDDLLDLLRAGERARDRDLAAV